MRQTTLLLVLVLATATVPTTALAQDTLALAGTFHGFAFGMLNVTESENHNWSIGHIWLIGKTSWKEFELLTIIAPEGPPKDLHNLQLTWRPKRIGWLDHIMIGRTEPHFGREFYVYRRDLVPMVNYSGITNHMVARDWGVEAGSHVGGLKLIAGAFLGKRTGGNVPDENGCCDFYLRGEYSPFTNVTVGASLRASAVDALGVDAVWKAGRSLVSMELIQTSKEGRWFTEWVILGTRKLVENVRLVARYESLREAKRTTIGAVVGVGKFVELKFEENFVENALDQFLGQLVFRW